MNRYLIQSIVIPLILVSVTAQAQDLALERPVSASSQEGEDLAPSNAVDGNSGSRWGSEFYEPNWIKVDLGQTFDITQVILSWESANAETYRIMVSEVDSDPDPTDSNWTTIAYKTGMPGETNRIDDLTIFVGSGRYIAMYGINRNTEYGFSLWNFEVYGEAITSPAILTQPSDQTTHEGQTATFAVVASGDTPLTYQWYEDGMPIYGATSSNYTTAPVTSADNGVEYKVAVSDGSTTIESNIAVLTVMPPDLARGRTATASSVEDNLAASYAVDGNSGTRWGSEFYVPNWIKVDLGQTFNISRVILNWESASAETYRIMVSDVDSAPNPFSPDWTTIAFRSGMPGVPPGENRVDDLTGLSGTGRYIAMFSGFRNTDYGFSLWDFEVYGNATTSPAILSHPFDQVVREGETATFSVVASGTAPLTYQWYKNSSPISGAVLSTYTTPPNTLADNNVEYDVTVTDSSNNSVTSDFAVLSVRPPDIARGKPASSSSQEEALVASNAVDGNSGTRWGSDFYEPNWIKIDLGATYEISGVLLNWESASAETYYILVSDVDSDPSPYNMEWTEIAYQPNMPGVSPGENRIDDLAGLSGIGRYIAMYGVNRNTDYGFSLWDFEVYGHAYAPPTIVTQPQDQTVDDGQQATFSVVASSGYPMTYQWMVNGTPITGANSSSYTTPAVTMVNDGDQYSVEVSNLVGSTTSASATLTVQAVPPTIVVHPPTRVVFEGKTATFSVQATGTEPLSYQWRKDGVAIPGATSETYTTPPVLLSDDGSEYDVIVSNGAGSVTSNPGELTVREGYITPKPPMCYFGMDSVLVDSGAKVYAEIGSNNDVTLEPGGPDDARTFVEGDIDAGNTVELKNGGFSYVDGTVTATNVILNPPDADASNVVISTVPPQSVREETVIPGSDDIWKRNGNCNGDVEQQGAYRNLIVESGCDVTLEPGEYQFREVSIYADATLIIQGPVKIYTQYNFRIGDRAILDGVLSPYDLDIYAGGEVSIGADVEAINIGDDYADFRAIITANSAEVGSRTEFTGCIQSRTDLTLGQESVIQSPDIAYNGDNRGALMEVELSSPDFPLSPSNPCPESVYLKFAEGRHQGKDYPATVVELGNTGFIIGDPADPGYPVNNCLYSEIIDQDPIFICEHKSHPCVHHPDQWDDIAILTGRVVLPLDGVRLTNFVAENGQIAPGERAYFNLVYHDTTNLQNGIYGARNPYEYDDSGNTYGQIPDGFTLSPDWESLKNEIEKRRRTVTEWIIWNAYISNTNPAFSGAEREDVDFDALPRIVREASNDNGQVGAFKFAGDWLYEGQGAACSGTQTFYQSNYTEDYRNDFWDTTNNDWLHGYECYYDEVAEQSYCHNRSNGVWPNSGGSLQDWGRTPPIPIDNRILAKATYDANGYFTGYVEVGDPIDQENIWDFSNPPLPYDPKPGDYFWRFDRCWHMSNNRHAMVLLADSYSDGNTLRLSAPIFDGSNMLQLRDRDFSNRIDPLLRDENLCDPLLQPSVFCDCDPNVDDDGNGNEEYPCQFNDGAADVTQNRVLNASGECICGGLGRTFSCPDLPGPRYDFLVAESRSAEEFFIYSKLPDSKPFDWSVISEGLITQPSFEVTLPHNRPEMADLAFGNLDDDEYEDIIWRRFDSATAWVALSSDNYSQWHDSNAVLQDFTFSLKDMGQYVSDTDPPDPEIDGFSDLVMVGHNADEISIYVNYNTPSNPTAFRGYSTEEVFPDEGEDLEWWLDRIRFGDFNGDGITDILRPSGGESQINFRDGGPVWTGNIGDIADLYFTDMDYDGRTDLVRFTIDRDRGWWSSFDGTDWSVADELGYDISACGENAEFRFLNWDGDDPNPGVPMADVFCLNSEGDWRVAVDDTPGDLLEIHARSNSMDNIVIGNFKTEGDPLPPNPNPELDDILSFGGSPIEHMF